MILNELNDKYDWHCEFDFELEYIHGLDTYRRKLEKKNLKRDLLRKIEKNKEIPEEVKNKYMKRYEMEKFYLRKGNTMERIWRKKSHFNEDKEKRRIARKRQEEKEEEERRERNRQKKAEQNYDDEDYNTNKSNKKEKEEQVTFCTDCAKSCIYCGKFGRGSSLVHVHSSCNERYKKNSVCPKCGKKLYGASRQSGAFCGGCFKHVNHCYFCSEKFSIS